MCKQQVVSSNTSSRRPRRRLSSFLQRRLSLGKSTLPEAPPDICGFSQLGNDELNHILSFCGAGNASVLSQTCKSLRRRCDTPQAWRVLCESSGKLRVVSDNPVSDWKEYYYNNPIVPLDVASIRQALGGKRRVSRVLVLGEITEDDTTVLSSNIVIQGLHNAKIRYQVPLNQPGIRVQSRSQITLCNIAISHDAKTRNTRVGSAAIVADGVQDSVLRMKSCQISSVSGKGVRVQRSQLDLVVKDSSISNCSSAGVFVDGDELRASFQNTHICSNGYLSADWAMSGHCGMRVVTGSVTLQNCSLEENSHTAISESRQPHSLKLIDTNVPASTVESYENSYFDNASTEEFGWIARYF